MSIFSTVFSLDQDEHDPACTRWVDGEIKVDGIDMGTIMENGKVYHVDDSKPCTCKGIGAPWIYQGSHVLPATDDPRGGCVLTCMVPDHIEREGRDDGKTGPKDWLRLSVYAETFEGESLDYDFTTTPAKVIGTKPYEEKGGDATVILNRPQVQAVRDALTGWLEREPE